MRISDWSSDVCSSDLKIIAAAEAEGVDPSVITARYEDFYLADMGALGVRPPTMAPRATENVGEMIGMIARLVEAGNAYEADGHVLFHVPSDPDYGALRSDEHPSELQALMRISYDVFCLKKNNKQ